MKVIAVIFSFFVLNFRLFACPTGEQEVCHTESEYRCETTNQWVCEYVTVTDPSTGETRQDYQCGYKDVQDCGYKPKEVCQCVAETPSNPNNSAPVTWECTACVNNRQFCGYYRQATGTWEPGGDYRHCP